MLYYPFKNIFQLSLDCRKGYTRAKQKDIVGSTVKNLSSAADTATTCRGYPSTKVTKKVPKDGKS